MERFLSHDRIISFHRNKLDVVKFPEDKLNMAYLDNKYSQFLLHLENSEVQIDMIKKVIKEIHNQLQCGDEVYNYSIKYPKLLVKIFEFLQYKSSEHKSDAESIRILSSECFKQFCLILSSKEQLDAYQFIKNIHRTFNDECEEVRLNIYQALIYYAHSRYGIDSLIDNKILEQIIDKVNEEQSIRVITLILTLSKEILNSAQAPHIALECNIITYIKKYLDTPDLVLRESVISNFCLISLCEDGKTKCVEEGGLINNIMKFIKLEYPLSEKEKERCLPILIASTRFLNNVSILKRAKVEIWELKGLERFFELLKNFQDEQLCLNVFGIIGNVSEEPRARKNLHALWVFMQSYIQHDNQLISEQAEITRNIIYWKP